MRNRLPLPPADPNLARTLELLRALADALRAAHLPPEEREGLPRLKPRNLDYPRRSDADGDAPEA